jgi:hypothetical protein
MADLHPITELTTAEVAHFLSEGWLLVRGLIPADVVSELVPRILERVVDDGSEWGGFLLKDSPRGGAAERIYSPRYARVLADLCGPGATIGMDGLGYMPIRFPRPSPGPWHPVELHVDGNHFHHHVDSPEQALVAVELWTDIEPGGGGTAILPGSHVRVAQILFEHEPQGLDCVQLAQLARERCQDIPAIEACGRAGDVLFMHPHLLHGSSTNLSQRIRIAGNRCVWLDRSLPWRRADPAGWSPVGLTIHQALAGHPIAMGSA